MKTIELWHGSAHHIGKPSFGLGKTYKDFGLGFYCTENLALAKEWACSEQHSGYANHYSLTLDDLIILNLSDDKYTILNWLALLVANRQFQVSTPVARQGIEYLKTHFLINISSYDAIIGYRADDSYFSFARAFVNNAISINQLSRAMRLGKLGEQFVLKSPKAFESLSYLGYEFADRSIYYPKRKQRDSDARIAYQQKASLDDLNGLFMRDIIREGVTNDDPRLR